MRYLNNTEAKKLLGVTSTNSLKARLKAGLKCYGEGKQRRFKESDIIEFMEGTNK